MAKNDYSIDEPTLEEGLKSKFNEAFLKMHRLHKLQDTINLCFINPVAMNNEMMTYNYTIIFNCCNALLSEVWSKLDDESKKDAKSFRDALYELMKKHPVHERKRNVKINSYETKLNYKNWELIEKWLYDFNLKIRELLGKTGYDSPDKDEWDEDVL